MLARIGKNVTSIRISINITRESFVIVGIGMIWSNAADFWIGPRSKNNAYLQKKELEYADADNANAEKHLANFWAAREACLKALGIGFGDDIGFSDVSVTHNDAGRPELMLAGGAKAALKELAGGDAVVHLSITDQTIIPPQSL